jgi:hypothetical protein
MHRALASSVRQVPRADRRGGRRAGRREISAPQCRPGRQHDSAAVLLDGQHLIVMGNHVKAGLPIASMYFSLPAKLAIIGNLTSGPYLGVAGRPSNAATVPAINDVGGAAAPRLTPPSRLAKSYTRAGSIPCATLSWRYFLTRLIFTTKESR